MWKRRFIAVLSLTLWTCALAAGEWTVEEVPCCYVISPVPGEAIPAEVQDIYEAVTGFWLPPGTSPAELASLWTLNVSPELLPSPPERALVVLYDDFEGFWCDVDYFGVAGLFYRDIPDNVLEGPLGAVARMETNVAVLGCIAACCLPTRWEATLAHELTHMIQSLAGFRVPELGLDPNLVVEGMARWTEHALGYRSPMEWDLEREMAAIWVREADGLSSVPLFVVYELGATLMGALAKRLPPPAILGLFSRGPHAAEGIPREEFLAGFREAYGAEWDTFLRSWLAGLRAVGISPAGKLLYEYRRRGIRPRWSFLWPLLSPEDRAELAEIHARLYSGAATEADLARAEAILEGVPVAATEEILEALERRQDSLKRWARIISGPAAAAEVTRLNIVRLSASPEEYVRTFVDLVNRYLIFQVPSPFAVTTR